MRVHEMVAFMTERSSMSTKRTREIETTYEVERSRVSADRKHVGPWTSVALCGAYARAQRVSDRMNAETRHIHRVVRVDSVTTETRTPTYGKADA